MPRNTNTLAANACRLFFPASLAFILLPASVCPSAHSQQASPPSVEGYITAVQSPNSFDVNNQHVMTASSTTYSILGKSSGSASPSSLPALLQVGAYVRVGGHSGNHVIHAETVAVRDEWDRKLSGIGVIDKVLDSGSQPIFRADGYRIRITPSTQLTFAGDLNSLADIGANCWIRFEGKRDQDGILIASKATFLAAKSGHFFAIPWLEVSSVRVTPESSSQPTIPAYGAALEDSANSQQEQTGEEQNLSPSATQNPPPATPTHKTKTRYSDRNSTYKTSANKGIQERVRRVGLTVIPAYQTALPDTDPAKIHFKFTAIESKYLESPICAAGGLILVPTSVLERLKNNDQLAAVIADCVALNMQRQVARIVTANRIALGIELGGDAAGAFVPGLGLATDAALGFPIHELKVRFQEERGRIALELLNDAGYDLRQAPEAWRLLAPKHLPADLSTLKYPGLSEYQLSILNLQYRATSTTSDMTPAPKSTLGGSISEQTSQSNF